MQTPHIESRSVSEQIAFQLGWRGPQARLVHRAVNDFPRGVTQAFLGDEVAAVFIDLETQSQNVALDKAALYAYHTSAEWGIVTTARELTVFNSHQLTRNFWYHLTPLELPENFKTQLSRGSIEPLQEVLSKEIFDGFTPQGIKQGELNKITPDPHRFLVPIDDALVQNLDAWRTKALRHTKTTDNFDANLQMLFSQLFVLRAVEDRKLNPSIPHLESALIQPHSVNVSKLQEIFTIASREIASDLFASSVIPDLPDYVLGEIVSDLYWPRQFPIDNARYDFSWIGSDVLGRAYQKYLSTLLVPLDRDPQLQFWEQPEREARLVSAQKKSGVYYTPSYLVRYLTERTIDEQTSATLPASGESVTTISTSINLPRIADFSCGSGSFLTAAIDAILGRLHTVDPKHNWANEIIKNKCLVGIDTDPRAVTLARLSVWLRLAEEPNPLPLPSLEEVIICGDALQESTWKLLPDKYDAIIGNPPFLSIGQMENLESLIQRFEVARGRFDYSYLFVELAIKKLNDRGALGLVVPNRLFKNKDANLLRKLLVEQCQLLSVGDFTSTPVFGRVAAYVGTLRARKDAGFVTSSHDEAKNRSTDYLRYLKVTSLPPQFVGDLLDQADQIGEEYVGPHVLAFDQPQPLGDSPWFFSSPQSRRTRTRLEASSYPLSEVAIVRQGIKTGANDIFMVRRIDEGGAPRSLVRIVNGFEDSFLIEPSLLHPVATGTDIQRYAPIPNENYIIYPYLQNGILPETILREGYPHLYDYLNSYREILTQRYAVSSGGQNWYELSSKCDQNWLENPKIFIRDLAQRVSFTVDTYGQYYCIGGTAIVPAEEDALMPLLAYLNSKFVNWYMESQSSVFRAGFLKFEPRNITNIPIPEAVISESELRYVLGENARQILRCKLEGQIDEQREIEESIDQLLCHHLGISLDELA